MRHGGSPQDDGWRVSWENVAVSVTTCTFLTILWFVMKEICRELEQTLLNRMIGTVAGLGLQSGAESLN